MEVKGSSIFSLLKIHPNWGEDFPYVGIFRMKVLIYIAGASIVKRPKNKKYVNQVFQQWLTEQGRGKFTSAKVVYFLKSTFQHILIGPGLYFVLYLGRKLSMLIGVSHSNARSKTFQDSKIHIM